MKKWLKGFGICLNIALISCQTNIKPDDCSPSEDYSQYVNPLVGTFGEGNTYPGAQVPFGMVQISPDTEKWEWGAASGYEYSDSTIYGFSMLHLHGTGIPDMGDILIMPTVGDLKLHSGSKDKKNKGYLSGFSHANEQASPGYYSVLLDDYNIRAELTSTNRAGMMRFTYPEVDTARVLIDLSHVLRWDVVWSNVRVLDDQTIVGMHQVKGWAKERYVYFAARFSKPFDDCRIFSDKKEVRYDSYKNYRFRSSKEASGKDIQVVSEYFNMTSDEHLQVKVGISAISTDNAINNLDEEIFDWDFDKVRLAARDLWNKELSKFDVKGSDVQKETFYTGVYHAFMAPVQYSDYNNEYRGLDQNIHQQKGFNNYTVFSLWDTYRATHPLFCLVQPERNADMINSMLSHYDQSVDSLLPIWSFWNNETWCMIGYHAVPVITDAYFNGIQGVDWEKALEACVKSATHKEYDAVTDYEQLGYVPYDLENESVSKTLEYAYDDYCIARLAKALGKDKIYERFSKRSLGYKNLFDKQIGWMRPKDSQGNWMEPFDPFYFQHLGAFTEGTTWQYSWYVPHDVNGLINCFGGADIFEAKLDSLFTVSHGEEYDGTDDIQGRIGQYWHGNEPSHHITYFYNYIGKPWKGQKLIREIINTQYGNKPNSLCGNDDCGQMSAWYIFSAMGFYPVAPSSGYYVLGSPELPEVTMNLSNGKQFKVVSENYGEENYYVKKVSLNGEELKRSWISVEEVLSGGELVFEMSSTPEEGFGIGEEAIPPSLVW
ncbi:GH92 family glycosyl hydrolase [Carboxylicivirga caseinilyticus]|uniref:GH92 family glycosyl hydrolase n=1 Tax=Carboxylicivirga caseinilyticus TaxID=3417572 RepID=UPI003D334479|nr:GH92 family glycosyl hydrolase [Marinilabiliaceae bacterium A049]